VAISLLERSSAGSCGRPGVGLLAYYAGRAVADTVARYGVYGGIALAILFVLGIGALHVWRRRAETA